MTRPRCVREGSTWFVTRRTTRRHFLLRPDRDSTTQEIYWYTTAVYAKAYGIELHAVQILSTHMHEVLTDVKGKLPAFLRERNRALANAMKCHRGWSEEFFQRASANCVELFGAQAVEKEMLYTMTNCVDAGLVHHPNDWPGAKVNVEDLDTRTVTVKRPTVYFDPENPAWPESVTIRITTPRLLEDAFGDRVKAHLKEALGRAVERARNAARRAGRVVGHIARIFNVPFTRRASSFEPHGAREPTFAAGGDRAEAARAMRERRRFLEAYRVALKELHAGNRSVVFPEGTWRWSLELFRVPTAPT